MGFFRFTGCSFSERRFISVRQIMAITKATHEGVITIGNQSIKCFVLEDGTRLITQDSFIRAIGRVSRKPAKTDCVELPPFLSSEALKPFIDNDLLTVSNSIPFRTSTNVSAIGYRATLLPRVCRVYLHARAAGKLRKHQAHIAAACEILLAGLAEIGIVGLVDEATGYQADRAADALQRILSEFISKELCKWVLTFDGEFYRELFRLRGIDATEFTTNRPQYIGHLTNDIVYKRLAPSVIGELQKRNPRTDSGWRKNQHHRLLTRDKGHPALREHLSIVIAMMKVASTWDEFYANLNIVRPVWTNQRRFSF